MLYQSTRIEAYREAADRLLASGRAFECTCTRRELQSATGAAAVYPGTCRRRGPLPGRRRSVRLRADGRRFRLDDRLQGSRAFSLDELGGDFVIWRRDGLVAYHLAVVVDDAEQGITEVVRGLDLLECTAQHLALQVDLELPSPAYLHLPVLVDAGGQKLSKQTGAAAVDDALSETVASVLALLGLAPPPELAGAPPAELVAWAVPRFAPERIPARGEVSVDDRRSPRARK